MNSRSSATVWCGHPLTSSAMKLLGSGLGPDHRLIRPPDDSVMSINLSSANDPGLLGQAEIAFGKPNPQDIIASRCLKWVHLTSAGYDPYDRADVRSELHARGGMLTTSSWVFAEPCAEHMLAMMLSLVRQIPQALENQRTNRIWLYDSVRIYTRMLRGQTVLILGMGSIARRLVELLAPFKMNVIAVRRTPQGDEPVPTFGESEVERLLPQADHVVDVLPGGRGTHRFMNAKRLACMKPTGILYNIGRGTTVDTAALIDALTSNRIAAAFIDVTDPEPLEPDHPLWTTPNCFITPHTAGGHAEESERLVQHFLANLNRYVQGVPMLDRII